MVMGPEMYETVMLMSRPRFLSLGTSVDSFFFFFDEKKLY